MTKMTIALIAKLRYKAKIEYSVPRKPPKTSPSFTSPNPMLSLPKINCPIRPIANKTLQRQMHLTWRPANQLPPNPSLLR